MLKSDHKIGDGLWKYQTELINFQIGHKTSQDLKLSLTKKYKYAMLGEKWVTIKSENSNFQLIIKMRIIFGIIIKMYGHTYRVAQKL